MDERKSVDGPLVNQCQVFPAGGQQGQFCLGMMPQPLEITALYPFEPPPLFFFLEKHMCFILYSSTYPLSMCVQMAGTGVS